MSSNDVVLADPDALKDWNRRVRRLANAYAPKYRPLVLSLGYHVNLSEGLSRTFVGVNKVITDSARYTATGTPLQERYVKKLLAEMVKAGTVKSEDRWSEDTGHRQTSFRTLVTSVSMDRHGFTRAHDFWAPFDEYPQATEKKDTIQDTIGDTIQDTRTVFELDLEHVPELSTPVDIQGVVSGQGQTPRGQAPQVSQDEEPDPWFTWYVWRAKSGSLAFYNAMDRGFNRKLVPSSAVEFGLSPENGKRVWDRTAEFALTVEERAIDMLRYFGTDEELASLGVSRYEPGKPQAEIEAEEEARRLRDEIESFRETYVAVRDPDGRSTDFYRKFFGNQIKIWRETLTDAEILGRLRPYREIPRRLAAFPGTRSRTNRAGTPGKNPGQDPGDRAADSYLMSDTAAPADDADDYEDDPEDKRGGALLDLAVGTLAGAVTGVVGYAVGGPGGALVSNSASPYLGAVFKKLVGPFWEDRSRRAEKMLETAAEAAGLTQEQLANRAAESEESRFLTNKAVQAAADTLWPEGVRAIGRAYAAGLLAKDKPVLDIRLRVLGIMEDLDELHVSLLELLVRYEPDSKDARWVAVPHRIPTYVNTSSDGSRYDNPEWWSIGRRKWTTDEICAVRPHLQPVLTSLLGELREGGLAQENNTAPTAVERLSAILTKQVNHQARQMQRSKKVGPIKLQDSPIPVPESTWSPTELGEKILAFYAEAGAEDSQDSGGHPGQATS